MHSYIDIKRNMFFLIICCPASVATITSTLPGGVAGCSGFLLSTSGPAHLCAQAMQRMAVAHTKTMRSASTTRMMETIMRRFVWNEIDPHLIRIHWLVYMYGLPVIFIGQIFPT